MPQPPQKSLDDIFGSQQTPRSLDDIFATTRTPVSAGESTLVSGKPFKKRPDLSAMEEAKGLARSLAQGATFGFWDELESLPYLLPGGEDPQSARNRIRAEMAKYREGSPILAPVAEFAGGVASGVGLTGLAAKGVPLAARIAASNLAQGGLSGAGSAEGGVRDRAVSALFGAGLAAATGGAASKIIGSARTAAKRGAWRAAPEVTMAEEAMESLGETPSQLAIRAGRMAADSPEAKTLDVLGEPGVRQARRIEALGGEAGQDINRSMTQRMAERLQRMAEVFPRITGKGREDVLQTIEQSIQRGKTASSPLYEQFKKQAPTASPDLDNLLKTPFGREAMDRARKNAANEQRVFIEPAVPSEPMALLAADGTPIMSKAQPQQYHPQSLDDIKKAMDDVIYGSKYKGAVAGSGGLSPTELTALKDIRNAYVTTVDKLYPSTYAKARAAWAGESALRNAMEDAEELAKRTVKPGEIQQYIKTLKSDSEREFFQRGWLNAQVDKIEAGGLTPKQIRTPLYEKQVTEVFGKDAPSIMDALRTEVELADNANAIIKGSRTTPLAKDVERELGPKWAQTARNTYMTVKNDPTYAFARALDLANEKFRGPTLAAERVRKAAALNTPAAQIGDLLNKVEQEYAARQAGRNLGTRLGTAFGAQSVRSLYDNIR